MQIKPFPDDTSAETISLTIPEPDLDFLRARDLAKETALHHCTTVPMLLAWNDKKTGKFYPTIECGKAVDPPWIVYARARGSNLTIDINQGDYVFMFLKL